MISGFIVRWQRGQVLASIRYLADRWGWTKSKAERFLILLRDEKMIKTETAAGTIQTIITICNYDIYNGSQPFLSQQPGQLRDTDETAARQPRDKTNKENKEEESKERKIYKRFAHLCLFEDEFLKLIESGFTKKQVDDILDEIANYKNNKKYVSLFLTAKAWLQKNLSQKVSPGAAAASNPEGQKEGRVVNIANVFKQALQYG
jgi:hypothetical protein